MDNSIEIWTLSLTAGSLIMLISCATRVAEAPNTDLGFLKFLFPVSNLGFLGVIPSYIHTNTIFKQVHDLGILYLFVLHLGFL